MRNLRKNQGFTLIELLVVVAIIAVLVVVIMVALWPALTRSRAEATKTLLTNMGTALANMRPLPNKTQFTKDAGPLAGSLDTSEAKASSQLLVFYLLPSRDVWQEAPLYKGRDYQPQFDPAQYKDQLFDSGGKIQFLADGWGTPVWYTIDRQGAFYLISAGEDMKFDTPDDFIYDSKSNTVDKRENLSPASGDGGSGSSGKTVKVKPTTGK